MNSVSSGGGSVGGPGSVRGGMATPVVGQMYMGGNPMGGGGVPFPLFASFVLVCPCVGIGGGGNLCIVWKAGCVGATFVPAALLVLGDGAALFVCVVCTVGVFARVGDDPHFGGAFGAVGIGAVVFQCGGGCKRKNGFPPVFPPFVTSVLGTMVIGAGAVGAALETGPVSGVAGVGVVGAPPWIGPGAGAVGHAPIGPVAFGTMMVGT